MFGIVRRVPQMDARAPLGPRREISSPISTNMLDVKNDVEI